MGRQIEGRTYFGVKGGISARSLKKGGIKVNRSCRRRVCACFRVIAHANKCTVRLAEALERCSNAEKEFSAKRQEACAKLVHYRQQLEDANAQLAVSNEATEKLFSELEASGAEQEKLNETNKMLSRRLAAEEAAKERIQTAWRRYKLIKSCHAHGPRHSLIASIPISSEDATCDSDDVWECNTDAGWVPYPEEVQEQLQHCQSHGTRMLRIDLGGIPYCIHLRRLKQARTDGQYSTQRDIRVAPSRGTFNAVNWWSPAVKVTVNGMTVTKHEILACHGSLKQGSCSRDTLEFNIAAAQFRQIDDHGRTITQVDVYESPYVQAKYDAAKRHLHQAGRSTEEVFTMHGTAKDVVPQVMAEGFKVGGVDKGCPLKHGSAHGPGVYTSIGSGIPAAYSKDSNLVILARAVLGKLGKSYDEDCDSWTVTRQTPTVVSAPASSVVSATQPKTFASVASFMAANQHRQQTHQQTLHAAYTAQATAQQQAALQSALAIVSGGSAAATALTVPAAGSTSVTGANSSTSAAYPPVVFAVPTIPTGNAANTVANPTSAAVNPSTSSVFTGVTRGGTVVTSGASSANVSAVRVMNAPDKSLWRIFRSGDYLLPLYVVHYE